MVSDDLKLKVGLSAVLIVGVGVLAWLAVNKGADFFKSAAASLPDAINPASTGNLVYRGISAPIEWATGGDTLGTLLASWWDPTTRAADQAMRDLNAHCTCITAPCDCSGGKPPPEFAETPGGAVTGMIYRR